MSARELEQLEKELRPLVNLIGMIKALVATSIACVVAVVVGAVWVANQTNAIASNATAIANSTSEVRSMAEDRKATLAEWTAWRRVKDETDTKLTAIAENQQKLIESHQRWMEKERDRGRD